MKQSFQYKSHTLEITYRVHKLMGISIYVDGQRQTDWHDSYAAATNDLRIQLNDLESK